MFRAFGLAGLALLASAPPAGAQTPCYAEYDTANFSDNVSMGGPLVAIQFVAPASFQATRIEVFTGEVNGASSVHLWSDHATLPQPQSMLGSGGFTIAPPNGWQGANLSASVSVSAGTTYWLGWTPVGGDQASVDITLPGNGQVYNASSDGGQTWFGPFQDNHHWMFKIFGNCNAPVIYCTAKLNSLGCMPAIGSTGVPSTSAPSGFVVKGSNVRNQKSGLLFYGTTGRAALPFQNGTLCVKSPIRRTPAVSSGGTPLPTNDCTGVFSIDMNSFAQGLLGGSPSPALLVPGTVVNCQWWGRDPGFSAPNNTTLTDGLEYTL